MSTVAKNKMLLAVIVVLLLANLATLYFFVVKNNCIPERKYEHGAFITETLEKEVGFSKEQLASFEKMKETHKKKMKPLFDDLRSAKDSFYVLMNRNEADSVLQSALKKIGEKQQALDMQMFRNFKEVRALCTQEQLVKYDTVIQKVIRKMISRSDRKKNTAEKKETK
jgi:hypothetical protein